MDTLGQMIRSAGRLSHCMEIERVALTMSRLVDVRWSARPLRRAGIVYVSLAEAGWAGLDKRRRWYRHNVILAAKAENTQLLKR